MFNKQQLVSTLTNLAQEIKVDPEYLLVGGSGAMVMLGLRETCRDVDVEISEEIFNYLEKKFPQNLHQKDYHETHPLYGKESVFKYFLFDTEQGEVELMLKTFKSSELPDITDGVWHLSTNDVLRFKLWLGREKDMIHLREAGLID